jgi:hypothetical protein
LENDAMNMELTQRNESTQLSLQRDSKESEGARALVEARLTIAQRFPRSEDDAFGKLIRSCKRKSFAEKVAYAFPRGNTTVTGPTVDLAREAARCFGNLDYGFEIVNEDDEWRHIAAYAHDLEMNTRVAAEDSFRKLIQRRVRGGGGATEWIKPDERDLRELTNRRAALLIRNCILQLLPKDMIDDALLEAKKTERAAVGENIEDHRKRVIVGFGEIGVPAKELERYLGHPIGSSSESEIVKLREIYTSIKDGNSVWSEYVSESSGDGDVDSFGDQSPDQPQEKPKRRTVADVAGEPKRSKSRSVRKSYDDYVAMLNGAASVDQVNAILRRAAADLDGSDGAFEALQDLGDIKLDELCGVMPEAAAESSGPDSSMPLESAPDAAPANGELFPDADVDPELVAQFERAINSAKNSETLGPVRDELQEAIDSGLLIGREAGRLENLVAFRMNQLGAASGD